MPQADVVVIGAGVMGAATAWRLSRTGRSVVLLEQFDVGHDRGSSHGAARVFRFSYDEPEYVRMAMEALPLWRELGEAAGEEILTVLGGFDLGPAQRVEAHARALGDAGARFDVITGKDAIDRYPSIAVPPEASLLHQPDAGVVAADRAVRAMVRVAQAAGTTLRERCRVVSLRAAADHVEVAVDGDAYRATVAVVTAGAWARPLLAGAGIDLPVTPSRETVAFFPTSHADRFPIFVEWTEHPLYALPSPGQGLKTGWHHTGRDADPDQRGGVERSVIDAMSAWVRERFPGAMPDPHHAEACLYTNTSDERFIVERHGPIVVGSPCSGHGFKFAPLIGERLARLALA